MFTDPLIAKLIMYILTFLFASLIGVLTWVGKSIISKINIIVHNQENDAIDRTSIKKDIDSIKCDISEVKGELKDINEIKQKLTKLETNETHIITNVSSIITNMGDVQKKLSELSEKVSVHEQIITKLK
jgi:septal ring factor EnvC (AmiA/AmiB activator)